MPTTNESVARSQTRAHAGIQASKPKKESAEHIEQIAVFFVLYFDVNATYRRYFFLLRRPIESLVEQPHQTLYCFEI